MDNEEQNSQEQQTPGATEQELEPIDTIHIHYFPDAIVILKEDAETPQQSNVVDSTLFQTKQPPLFIAYAICSFYLFLIFSCIAFQFYMILNPPIATVTIIPKMKTVSLAGTLQLGRLLSPLTISQSQTVPTTGKGHQDARAATGTVTFYNGQLNSIFIPAGLILTGSDGVQIVTDQDASIPASNLPQVGQVTVQAHALSPGSKGNIAAYDINQGCCATAIKAVNSNSFYNGQDERNFQTVSKNDIDRAASPLKATLAQSMSGALEGQLKPSEQLSLLPCSPTVTPNRNVGDEATTLKVIVSLTCSAVAYNTNELENKARALLTFKALSKLSGYS
ncbi:MAG TPA: baseplate J/gp47 family protein, partial [Methylomirabilota bacterium]|nr:baseplate J/gp47 family protein [Methylomirabilota bacterium]